MRTTTLLCILATTACAAARANPVAAQTGGASATPAAGVPAGSFARALATWFGPGFYGQTTACGQVLTPVTVGVANRTLPCGTLLRVSYHRHRLVVPVIDRGPYGRASASFDLTAGAAQALGIGGSVRIAARVVGASPNAPTLGQPPSPPGATGTSAAAALAGGASAAPAA